MQPSDYLVVKNLNADGNRVRPSNWTERFAGNAAEFEGGRLKYDARVLPCTACLGLRVDRAVDQDMPCVMETISSFMR